MSIDRAILERIEQTLEWHEYLLTLILQKERQMVDTLDDVKADAAAQTTVAAGTKVVIDHAVALLDDIAAKLANAGTDPAKLAEIRKMIADSSSSLTAATADLAAAVERDTQKPPFQPSGNG